MNLKTQPGQVNITVIMNSHGTGFQDSIWRTEIQGIHKLKGKVYQITVKYTVRIFILCQKTSEGKQMLPLVTTKWG